MKKKNPEIVFCGFAVKCIKFLVLVTMEILIIIYHLEDKYQVLVKYAIC